jgi:Metallo-beta-lactamase superfamily
VTESVAPSKLGTQPIGEVARVAEGVHHLKLPVPFPLGFVSVYLVEGGEGWTVIDAGYDYVPARETWKQGAREVGFDLRRDVARIVVTHFHPDHIGASRWLQEHTGAPVYMLEKEIGPSREVWEERNGSKLFTDFLTRYGMGVEMAEKAAAAMRSRIRLPEEMLPLYPGEDLALGSGTANILHTPGHVDFRLTSFTRSFSSSSEPGVDRSSSNRTGVRAANGDRTRSAGEAPPGGPAPLRGLPGFGSGRLATRARE